MTAKSLPSWLWSLVAICTVSIVPVSCAASPVAQVSVVIPSGRSFDAGCGVANLGHEYQGQSAILCGTRLDVRFRFFKESEWAALTRTLRESAQSRFIVLPFEVCPESIPPRVRGQFRAFVQTERKRGSTVVAAIGNAGSLSCVGATSRRFPADVPAVISVGSGSPKRRNYSLRWQNKPDYYIDTGQETLGTAGSSFAAARLVLWLAGQPTSGFTVLKNGRPARPMRGEPTGAWSAVSTKAQSRRRRATRALHIRRRQSSRYCESS